MAKKVHLLIIFTCLLACQIITNLFALTHSLQAYGNPVATPYLWVTPIMNIATELGETFTVKINITNVENLHAFEFKLSYNTTLLDTVQVEQGSFFPPPPSVSIAKLEANETAGIVWVNISLSSSETPKSGSGTLATITFAVTFAPPSETYCVLDLHDTMLYDGNMASIVHDGIDGLYFWQTLLDDPPESGLILDLTTQKGGVGPNQTDGTFDLDETVVLIAHLTSNDDPVQQKMVAFEVRNPQDDLTVSRVVLTDENGYAIISFRIPSLPVSVGTWTVVASASVSSVDIWDWLTFIVRAPPPVGGQMTLIQENYTSILQTDTYLTIIATMVLLAIIINETKRVI